MRRVPLPSPSASVHRCHRRSEGTSFSRNRRSPVSAGFEFLMGACRPMVTLVGPLIRRGFQKHLFERGVGRHTPDQVTAMGRTDVETLATWFSDLHRSAREWRCLVQAAQLRLRRSREQPVSRLRLAERVVPDPARPARDRRHHPLVRLIGRSRAARCRRGRRSSRRLRGRTRAARAPEQRQPRDGRDERDERE
jgi:hypothetical protein